MDSSSKERWREKRGNHVMI